MEKFTKLTGIAAPFPRINVDTDLIIPKQYLKTIKRTGLGVGLFSDVRYDDDGNEKPDFVLNREPYRKTRILIAGENFGCGSSREHAPWALADFGIRCIVAPSFADIFYNNCFKNGILPIKLPQEQVDLLMADAGDPETATMTIDLEAQKIVRASGEEIAFEVDEAARERLLKGLDDIGLTLQRADNIEAFEEGHRQRQPWLFSAPTAV